MVRASFHPFCRSIDFETGKSQVTTLITAACNLDNVYRMDPAWNLWLIIN